MEERVLCCSRGVFDNKNFPRMTQTVFFLKARFIWMSVGEVCFSKCDKVVGKKRYFPSSERSVTLANKEVSFERSLPCREPQIRKGTEKTLKQENSYLLMEDGEPSCF